MEEVDVTTARRELRSILDRAYIHHEPTGLTRHGELIALVVPVTPEYLEARHAEKVALVNGGADRLPDV